MELLVKYVRRAGCGRGGAMPKVLVVSPPKMGTDWDKTFVGKIFNESSNKRAEQLPEIYSQIAKRCGAEFFDAAPYTEPGDDCIHFLPDSHARLGAAMAGKVREIFK
jgi:hypothetical protein